MAQRKRVLAGLSLLFALGLLAATSLSPTQALAEDPTPTPTPTPTCIPGDCTEPDGVGGGRHLGG